MSIGCKIIFLQRLLWIFHLLSVGQTGRTASAGGRLGVCVSGIADRPSLSDATGQGRQQSKKIFDTVVDSNAWESVLK